MGHFRDGVRALWTAVKNVGRPPQTVQFPEVKRQRAERYRQSFALLHDEAGDELCIGCVACEKICPSQIIFIKQSEKRPSPVTGKKRGYADDFTLDMNACIYCELCVQVCPTDAIVMCHVPEKPGYSREDLVLTMDKLYANEKSKQRSWGDATRLLDMQDPKKGQPDPKAAKAKASADAAPAKPAADAAAKPADAPAPKPATDATAKPADAPAPTPTTSATVKPGNGDGKSAAPPPAPVPVPAAKATPPSQDEGGTS